MRTQSLKATLNFLTSWLEYRARHSEIPGFSIAVLSDDDIVFSQAYGWADVEEHQPIATGHLFNVASQSKMFTTTAILQLVSANKMQLDDHVCMYVPWLRGQADRRFEMITIRQVLSHTAGLFRDGSDADFWELRHAFPDEPTLRATILESGVACEPNTTIKYSNVGFGLLGQVITAVSRQSYANYVTEHIVAPLKLRNTFPDYTPKLENRLATAYSAPFEHVRRSLKPRLPTRALAPAAGILSMPTDMCRFAAAHFYGNETLLNDELKRESQRGQWVMTSGYDSGTEYGLGFQIQTVGARRLVGHHGHLAGHVTATFFDPIDRLAVAVMTNCREKIDDQSDQIV